MSDELEQTFDGDFQPRLVLFVDDSLVYDTRLWKDCSGNPILPSVGEDIIFAGNQYTVKKVLWNLDDGNITVTAEAS